MSFISNAMGWILARLSELLGHNFAASVLLFTVFVNLLMLPLTLKTQKSTAKQAKLKPKLDALKKKYGSDRQKYAQAMNDLYAKENVSMSGGCLPMIIRLIVMMGVYWAVSSPLTYVLQLDATAVNAAKEWSAYVKVVESGTISADDWNTLGLEAYTASGATIELTERLGEHDADYYAKLRIVNDVALKKSTEDGTAEKRVADAIKSNAILREVEVTNYVVRGQSNYSPIVADVFEKNNGKTDDLNEINFNLFGLNLTETPNFSWNFSNWQAIWIIPIASFATAMLTSIISLMIQKKANPDAPNMAAMMLIMPLFSLYIAFKVPGAVGFYWACSNLIAGAMQAITQTFYGPSVVVAKSQSKTIVARAEQEQSRIASKETDKSDS